ncbi:MAG TPA: NmrA family NAD(P)-binding protein [Nocardia sp.]|uniref:NmrA family NAD(P)-binding protein n=1 Tax=Nocardia TaxID=1817 RepID=UPI0024537659|nr:MULTISPECIES: NmrA family NAD(P)-binding protein [Nocardia]HLS79146.1 NmrA family NAD(P)-binding protein [Nocardia sp.]
MILVTAATGSIGRHLVRALHEQGAPVRALVREEAKGRALGVDYAVGDFDDPASLAAALRGVRRVFLNGPGALPVDGEQPGLRGQKALIDAARAAEVAHVVKVSVWDAAPAAPLSQGLHWEVEEYLRASGLGSSVLQPAGFMQNFLAPTAFTPDGRLIASYGDAPVAYVDAADIAAAAAALLTAEQPAPGPVVLTGSQALTDAQVAAKLSAVLGRTVELAPFPAEQIPAALTAQGLPEWFATQLATLVAQVAAGAQSVPTDGVARLTGRPARTFDQFLADNAEAVRAATHSAATGL